MTVMKTTVDVLKDAIMSYWTKALFATGLRRNVCCSVNPLKCSGCGNLGKQCATCYQTDDVGFEPELWLCKKCRHNPHMGAFNSIVGGILGPK